MHSLINIIERRDKNGNSYYQVRFFKKNGHCYAAKSYPSIKSRTEIYLFARKALKEGIIPFINSPEARTYGILTLEEVKQILAIEENEPHILRAKLIVLLGITCGLGVGEIQQLRKENIDYQHNMLKVINRNFSRLILYIDTTRDLLKKIDETYPDHVFVIPNLNNIRRPCDPITITRGLSIILMNARQILKSLMIYAVLVRIRKMNHWICRLEAYQI
ncbi:hypothetical protein FACS1894130_11080 [Spirochaetia bacterium]|nr:hypothetical protein FACS1894130_11080 [Spirochaetia bacterium]